MNTLRPNYSTGVELHLKLEHQQSEISMPDVEFLTEIIAREDVLPCGSFSFSGQARRTAEIGKYSIKQR